MTRLFLRHEITPALEPLAMAKAEGRRAVLRDIKTDIEAFFGSYGRAMLIKGQQEALELEQRYETLWKEQQDGRTAD